MKRAIYSLLLYLLVPLILLRLLYRSIKNPAYRQRIAERFGFYTGRPAANGIWVHAVSVGEAIAAVKLVRALAQQQATAVFTVTCGTPTGSEIIRRQLGDSVTHVYAPYDLPGSVHRFIKWCRPATGIIMETELWPNLFRQASLAGARLMISNMRLSDNSFRRYGHFPGLVAATLADVHCFAAQTEPDAQRAISLGADPQRVHVVGNLKFEMDTEQQSQEAGEKLKAMVASDRPVWLAGSTHEGEDMPVLDAHAALLRRYPDLLLILVPRHPERFDSVYSLCQARFSSVRRTALELDSTLASTTQVLLLDTIGELSAFIAISDWAFIGGSLVPVGGHNILEACQAGVPVVYGNYMDNFREVASVVGSAEAGIQVADATELMAACEQLAVDPIARNKMGRQGSLLMRQNSGALARTLHLVKEVVKCW